MIGFWVPLPSFGGPPSLGSGFPVVRCGGGGPAFSLLAGRGLPALWARGWVIGPSLCLVRVALLGGGVASRSWPPGFLRPSFCGVFLWLFVFLLPAGCLFLLAWCFLLVLRLLPLRGVSSGFGPGVGFVRASCACRRRFSSWRLSWVSPGFGPVWGCFPVALGRPLGRPCLSPSGLFAVAVRPVRLSCWP